MSATDRRACASGVSARPAAMSGIAYGCDRAHRTSEPVRLALLKCTQAMWESSATEAMLRSMSASALIQEVSESLC